MRQSPEEVLTDFLTDFLTGLLTYYFTYLTNSPYLTLKKGNKRARELNQIRSDQHNTIPYNTLHTLQYITIHHNTSQYNTLYYITNQKQEPELEQHIIPPLSIQEEKVFASNRFNRQSWQETHWDLLSKSFWHTMTSYDRHSSYDDSPYRTVDMFLSHRVDMNL
ncbi:hypothetical protein EYC84_011931 [Monilinia fructicola]|uniref:Uncharacterized protein n=1 Tax=Monilinia fructicola TaxID=38448 RepID=A0A5M9J435_MONFR|nr:hypothetical protein EYC84_011931 [Monilinia fructicola]